MGRERHMGKRHKLGERQAYILSRERHGVVGGGERERQTEGRRERECHGERDKKLGVFIPLSITG